MQSLRYLYRIGNGPSSSHTMGPEAAAKRFLSENPDSEEYKVVLLGSLAKTGKGHMTDAVLARQFGTRKVRIIFDKESPTPYHPNTLDFYAINGGSPSAFKRFYSIGGGEIIADGETPHEKEDIYKYNSFNEISKYCSTNGIRIWQYAEETEGPELRNYLLSVWECMKASISEGLVEDGILPGGLGVKRKAKYLYSLRHRDMKSVTDDNRRICAYAYAVSEQNASGKKIVTAPTCGSCGVVPAVLKYLQHRRGFSDELIVRALATGGIVGNLIKHNASISGAECGCQAEIGTACAMAAAAAAELSGLNLDQIEYSAEMSIEHHLGLTCDPVYGLVQIPCIERNAVAAMRALDAVDLADCIYDSRKISFDMVVKTMYETGRDLQVMYRETAQGGLARIYSKENR